MAPEDPTIYANALNYFSETTNDEIIADLIERAKAVGVSFDNPVMTLLAGRTELRNQNFEEAHAYLLRHYNKHEHTHLMLQRAFAIGNACDKLGKPAEAWEAFSFGNMIRDKLERNARKYSREAYKIRINAGRKYIDKYRDDPDFRAQFETDPDHENMCFVLSFPRSGTTLLDNILRSHPKIEAFEEKPIVVETMKRVAESMGAGMMMTQYDDIMDRIFATEGPELRRIYMSMLETFRDEKSDETGRLRRQGATQHDLPAADPEDVPEGDDRVRATPSLRHPAVLLHAELSRQRLQPLLHLHGALGLALRYGDGAVDLGGRDVRDRPGDRALRGAGRGPGRPGPAVIDRMGLDWDDKLTKFYETARSRRVINTASKNQVTQKLYTSSRQRWLNYREHFEPYLPTLDKWVTHFGYESVLTDA